MRYVGARYTPDFLGTYDATRAYENFCVVDDGFGTSYISKKPVPVGTPLTDTSYWAIYGSANGAVVDLQQQIGELSDLDTSTQTNLVSAINELVDITNVDDILYIDNMSGDTDTEKVQAAFDLVNENKISIIVATRLYDITDNIDIKIRTSFGRIYVIGVGKNSGFKMNGHKFYSTGLNRAYGGASFDHITFYEDVEMTTEVLFDCDTLIRTRFSNCVFYKCGTIIKSTTYTQDTVFLMCSFMNCYQIVNTPVSYVLVVDNCEFEVVRSDAFVITLAQNIKFNGNILESVAGSGLKIDGCKGGCITNSYFEDYTVQAKPVIDLSNLASGSAIEISDNWFASLNSSDDDTTHSRDFIHLVPGTGRAVHILRNVPSGVRENLCRLVGARAACNRLVVSGNQFATGIIDTTPSSVPVEGNTSNINGTTRLLGSTENHFIPFYSTGAGRIQGNLPAYGRTVVVEKVYYNGVALDETKFVIAAQNSDLVTITTTDSSIVSTLTDKVARVDIHFE